MEQKINLVVCGKEIVFAPNQTAYNKFINEMAMDNKVAPAHGYLMRPGAALQLAGKVNEIYAPELEIEVKN